MGFSLQTTETGSLKTASTTTQSRAILRLIEAN